MSLPHVRLRLPDGRTLTVGAGGVIGRLATASCRIEDPRVSEIHALVSLRGRRLKLLAMNAGVQVDGEPVREATLTAGQHIALVPGLDLDVVEVVLPERVLALALPGGEVAELFAPVHCLVGKADLELVAGFWPEAVARVWTNGQGWSIDVPGHPPEELRPGRSYAFPQGTVEVVSVRMDAAGVAATRQSGWERVPMEIVVRYTTVHIRPEGRPPFVVDGLAATLISELGVMGCPARWETVAASLWKGRADAEGLRPGWDQLRRRLRETLRESGIRDDLVRIDGRGNVELYLLPGDRLIDET